MPLGPVVNKGGFEAGLDPRDAAFIDIGFLLLAGAGLDIQIEQALAIDQGNAQLFWVSCINQHSFHVKETSIVRRRKRCGAQG